MPPRVRRKLAPSLAKVDEWMMWALRIVTIGLLAVVIFFLKDFYSSVQNDQEKRRLFESATAVKMQAIEGKVDNVVADVRRLDQSVTDGKREIERRFQKIEDKIDRKADKR